jgi:peroxiredoxin
MRKVILAGIVVFFVLPAVLLITGMIKKIHRQKEVKERISTLPSFKLMRLDNVRFNSSEINQGPVLIVRFHPECEHCQYELTEILKSEIPDLAAKVILISNANPDSIRKFLDHLNYHDYPSVIALADTAYTLGEIFGNEIVPSNYIYNKELDLIKVLSGEARTETILKYLRLCE